MSTHIQEEFLARDADRSGGIAIVGGGPAGLVAAIALARRGVRTTVLERDVHPDLAPRFHPDRSYTIDITGHGLRALRHIDATGYFDDRLLPFRGIQYEDRMVEEWSEPGWTGSRGDILRALMAVITDRHKDLVHIEFGCRVSDVDVDSGAVSYTPPGADAVTRQFDLVVGADGAGSVVRQAMQKRLPGFTVVKKSLPNYLTMIALDRLSDQLDETYLHALATRPFCVAGAVPGDEESDGPRWFCAVGTRRPLSFSSAAEARTYLRKHCPRVLDLASDASVAAFAGRTCYHIGQKLTCSRLDGGRAVLVGDAAGPFPPIGQGINAAMEAAMELDRCIAAAGTGPVALAAAAASYSAAWKPELDAISWISEKMLFENRLHTLRANLTMRAGINVVGQAKSSTVPYSQVRAEARRWGPLWW
jgi:2-polyprenyl-6-methoxyphenol hydroxylase-like FAD-dependent oxidoreductase